MRLSVSPKEVFGSAVRTGDRSERRGPVLSARKISCASSFNRRMTNATPTLAHTDCWGFAARTGDFRCLSPRGQLKSAFDRQIQYRPDPCKCFTSDRADICSCTRAFDDLQRQAHEGAPQLRSGTAAIRKHVARLRSLAAEPGKNPGRAVTILKVGSMSLDAIRLPQVSVMT